MSDDNADSIVSPDSKIHRKWWCSVEVMYRTNSTILAVMVVVMAMVVGVLATFSVNYVKYVVPLLSSTSECNSTGIWTWECQKEKCIKVEMKSSSSRIELNTCKLTCGNYSVLFPRPSGYTRIGNYTVPFLPSQMKLLPPLCGSSACPTVVKELVRKAFNNLKETLTDTFLHVNKKRKKKVCLEGRKRSIDVTVDLTTTEHKLSLDTDESSSIFISSDNTHTLINIQAKTFFGARHALETASQLTAYTESHDALQIVGEVTILDDKPAYRYRGLLLDTSRNYFSVESILKLIRGMSYNKMNTLHWHITDTHSFPIEIPTVPELSKYGAYSSERIYSPDDVRKIVKHGLIHGIRILPEFDQPAHCGEGWQFGPKNGLGNLAVCVKKEPWRDYCGEPPCGQLNPTNPNVYEVLGKIYKTYFELFSPDMFHAGGDEVHMNCWNSTEEITSWMKKKYGGVDTEDFMKLWGYFVTKTSEKIHNAKGNDEIPLIFWSSEMTTPKYLTKYLDPKKHIIQIWENSTEKQIPNIVETGFRTIFSTHDTLYLDCGYGNWISEGNNWCSPYKDWKILYKSDPINILKNLNVTVTEKIRKTILGQEAAMWSEQVDEHSFESKVWPRTSALAERLWSNPDLNWTAAEYRLVFHRQRLVERGIQADALQPLWCLQNSGFCD